MEFEKDLENLTVEKILKELKAAQEIESELMVELLKHYLANFILFLNVPLDDRDSSPIKEKLLKIAILLEKLQNMKNKSSTIDPHRIVEERMLRNKPNTRDSKTNNPRKKFRINSENQKDRTKVKEDFNIDIKKGKSNKFN